MISLFLNIDKTYFQHEPPRHNNHHLLNSEVLDPCWHSCATRWHWPWAADCCCCVFLADDSTSLYHSNRIDCDDAACPARLDCCRYWTRIFLTWLALKKKHDAEALFLKKAIVKVCFLLCLYFIRLITF